MRRSAEHFSVHSATVSRTLARSKRGKSGGMYDCRTRPSAWSGGGYNCEFARQHVILQSHFMCTELVTTLTRHATKLLADVGRDKGPILITQHGLPSAYLVDVESFELLQRRMAVLEGIARGEMAVAEGRLLSHPQARDHLARWLK